jgi:predicted phage terminase large subunit-like protein
MRGAGRQAGASTADPLEIAAELLAPGGKVVGWELTARPDQVTPGRPGSSSARLDWNGWLVLAGRGWGKSRTGAEDARIFGTENPGIREAIVAPTYADARDTCIEGDSGLLKCIDQATGGHYGRVVEAWNRSLGELVLRNGSRYKLFAAVEPDRLRGPQHHRAWCDELAAWDSAQECWDQLQFGLRLGDHPQTVITTTPRPMELLIELSKRADFVVTRGSTFDNAEHLAANVLAALQERYGDTRLGRQELYADILTQVEGALWSRDLLEETRVQAAPAMARVVVGVDPSVTEGGNRTGICAAGLGEDGRAYVLHSEGLRAHPDLWARRVVQHYRDFVGDRVVAEANQGGELIRTVLETVDPHVPLQLVNASRGKRTRAEPVAALFEQGKVSLVGHHAQLEDELVTYTGAPGEESPDVLDAMVWALTALMIDGARPRSRWFVV